MAELFLTLDFEIWMGNKGSPKEWRIEGNGGALAGEVMKYLDVLNEIWTVLEEYACCYVFLIDLT